MLTITTTDLQQLIQYLLNDNRTAYTKVKFKHPKKTKNKTVITTLGRVIFNAMLPDDYIFVDQPVDRKILSKILSDISNKYNTEVYKSTVNKIQKYSMLLSTIIPATIEISKLELPEEIQKEKDKLVEDINSIDPVEFDKKIDELYDKLQKYLEKENVTFFDMVKSGTKGKKSDLQQLFLAWGPAYQPLSNDMPIISHSLLEGMKPEELYYGANKARYAAYLKSINVAPIGYLARKMRWALADVVISSTTEDCKTNKYFELKVTHEISKIILGRYYLDEKDNKLKIITEKNVDKLIDKVIKLRSPLYCKAKDGICKICYGNLYNIIKSNEIGITAMGSVHIKTLNKGMKLSHQKLTSKEEVNFIEDIKKWYE